MTARSDFPERHGRSDPGLQNERTALAWIRTDLALLGLALLVARATAEQSVVFALGLAGAAGVLASLVVRGTMRRYAHSARSLAQQKTLPDDRLPALVAALTGLVGVFAFGYVVTN